MPTALLLHQLSQFLNRIILTESVKNLTVVALMPTLKKMIAAVISYKQEDEMATYINFWDEK